MNKLQMQHLFKFIQMQHIYKYRLKKSKILSRQEKKNISDVATD